jgi:Fe-S cluster assembly iron-binding protein IscA
MAQLPEICTMPNPFYITEVALDDMRTVLAEFAYPQDMIRIRVVFVPSMQFCLSIESESPQPEDRVLEYPGVRLVIDGASLSRLQDYVLDYCQFQHGCGYRFSKRAS